MKKIPVNLSSFLPLRPLLMGALLLALPSSCSDDNEVSDANPDAKEFVADPTADQIQATYSGLTAVIGSDLDDMGLAIVNRLTRTTAQLTDDVQAVVLTPGTLKSGISALQAASMMKIYQNGGTIIMVEPQKKNWQNLLSVLHRGQQQLEQEGYDTDDIDDGLQLMAMQQSQSEADDHGLLNESDAVALRLNETYVINELEQQADRSIENTDAVTGGEDGKADTMDVVNEDEYLNYEVSDYRYGKSADLLINWMNQADESARSLQAGKRQAAGKLRATASSDLTN